MDKIRQYPIIATRQIDIAIGARHPGHNGAATRSSLTYSKACPAACIVTCPKLRRPLNRVILTPAVARIESPVVDAIGPDWYQETGRRNSHKFLESLGNDEIGGTETIPPLIFILRYQDLRITAASQPIIKAELDGLYASPRAGNGDGASPTRCPGSITASIACRQFQMLSYGGEVTEQCE